MKHILLSVLFSDPVTLFPLSVVRQYVVGSMFYLWKSCQTSALLIMFFCFCEKRNRMDILTSPKKRCHGLIEARFFAQFVQLLISNIIREISCEVIYSLSFFLNKSFQHTLNLKHASRRWIAGLTLSFQSRTKINQVINLGLCFA